MNFSVIKLLNIKDNLNFTTTFIDDLVPEMESKDLLKYVTFYDLNVHSCYNLVGKERTSNYITSRKEMMLRVRKYRRNPL